MSPRDGGRGEEGDVKIIKMYYVHAPTPHDKCKHYVLQTFINKYKYLRKWWFSLLAVPDESSDAS